MIVLCDEVCGMLWVLVLVLFVVILLVLLLGVF